MRIAFVNTLFEAAKKDKRITLLTADLGFSVFEEFMEKLPRQYLNVGVAEQNMTGVAAGMAMQGKVPVIYSIVPFVTMRNFEQLRDDICYQGLNVKVVGVGSGFSYGPYGHTHHGLEDIGIVRTIPGITVFAPGDPVETKLVTRAALSIKGPVYIRLGKAGEPKIHSKLPKFSMGKGIVIRQGGDVILFSCGTMLPTAMQVSDILKRKYSVGVVSIHTIKPLDESLIIKLSKRARAIFTIEEHAKIGGLGSAIAEVLAEQSISTIFKRFGTPDRFTKVSGLQEYMREANGLLPDQIASEIDKVIKSGNEKS